MGHQESYVYTNRSTNIERNNEDIKKIIEIFKKYDIRCEGDWVCDCCGIVHIKKNIGLFKKGMDLLYVAGDRQAMRDCFRLFDIYFNGTGRSADEFTPEEIKLMKRVKFAFIENVFYLIEAEKDKDILEFEELKLLPDNLPSNFDKVNSMAENIKNRTLSYAIEHDKDKKIEYAWQYDPKSKQEMNDIIQIYKQEIESNGYDYKIKTKKSEVWDGEINIDHRIFANDVEILKVSENWNNSYTLWNYNLDGQNLRNVCRELLEKDNKGV